MGRVTLTDTARPVGSGRNPRLPSNRKRPWQFTKAPHDITANVQLYLTGTCKSGHRMRRLYVDSIFWSSKSGLRLRSALARVVRILLVLLVLVQILGISSALVHILDDMRHDRRMEGVGKFYPHTGPVNPHHMRVNWPDGTDFQGERRAFFEAAPQPAKLAAIFGKVEELDRSGAAPAPAIFAPYLDVVTYLAPQIQRTNPR